MEITDIKIRKVADNTNIKAFVTVTLDNELVIHNIRLVDLDGKIILSMPSKKGKDGEFLDFVHPVNSEFRKKMSSLVLDKYNSLK